MIETLDLILPTIFCVAAVLYVCLAVRIFRAVPSGDPNWISYFFFLNGAIVAGAALSFGATDPRLFGLGRVLTYFGGGFLPVVFYLIYRYYAIGRPHPALVAVLCIIPAVTTSLALTNPLHHLLWNFVPSPGGMVVEPGEETRWFSVVFLPFVHVLFGYAFMALAGRVQTITRAHRRNVVFLLACASFPFAVSLADRAFGLGPPGFPITSLALVLTIPFYWWVTLALRVHEFSPLAYQTMFHHLRDPIIVLDRAGQIVSVNREAEILLGAREHALVGTRLLQDIPEFQALLTNSHREQDVAQTVRMPANRYYEITCTPMIGPSGQEQGTVVACRDVTERKEALRALRDSEHLIRSLIENSSNGILRFAPDESDASGKFRCIFANGAAERFLDNGTLVGMPIEKIALLEPDRLLERFGGPDSGTPISFEAAVETEECEEKWLRIVGEPVGRDFSVTLIDITQRKQNEDRILADSLRDPLTGVLNRRGFEAQAVERLANSETGAVLYLDLNHFKAINDRFGHPAGDALLKAFGHRLEFCLRPEDVLARLGGDEFAIVLPEVSVEDAKHVAQRLVDAACEPYIIQGQEIECTASVGIALMPQHGHELWPLVSAADQAMYNAKGLSPIDAANDRTSYVDAAVAS